MNAMGQVVEQRFLADPVHRATQDLPGHQVVGLVPRGRAAGDDAAVQAAALTFVSDLTLLSAGFARLGGGWQDFIGASLDHSVWFHRPVRADEWFLYETDSPAAPPPGAVLRADLGRRRHARRDRRPGGPHPLPGGLRFSAATPSRASSVRRSATNSVSTPILPTLPAPPGLPSGRVPAGQDLDEEPPVVGDVRLVRR